MIMETITKKNKMYLAGKWVLRENTMAICDPQDNRLIATVPAASTADMTFAIEEAKEGFRVCSELPTHERIAILHRAADWVDEHKEAYAATIASEGSKTIKEARKEVRRCVETLRISAEEARRLNGETIAFDQMPGSENRFGYYYRFPIGIIGAITPFNDPLNLVAHKVGPAIAAGNSIIVKPATSTPLSALMLAEAFDKAGLPAKILSVVTGNAIEIGEVLVTHPDVRMISFTGGLVTGKAIMQKAGLKKMSMELGSNSPVIVLNDADINDAVESNVSGAFWAAGQNCLGVQRIYVQKDVYEAFVARFVDKTKQYRVGNKFSEETDMGPMINEREAKRVETWVQEAVDRGGKLLCGGKRNGAFYEPTVMVDVPKDCRIVKEEVFGPVVTIFSVVDLEEAIRESNSVDFGLQAGIFSRDIDKVFHAVRKLDVGGVMVNDSSDYRIDAMPFGGVKGSGIGREGVKFALQEMTEPKVVCFRMSR
ncbi:aldehyde dehydrogenase [Paenibacillus baekrokdamisoli]|uniref:3-sulfolactaldehyde dehydrogenase n=1 Tax=Paenibacillus baekrokdamisoli TaxID=1712516 RepID=A0A3G9J509_9BACL|nr:aldehyde dehydrogenase family protein [Paenibacillus baekrokdamisoli]MBB3069259.1 glyceraldehyde-3-phosphate dehydrogenase (NADP+) [Paenibacillus baekrokdamisoli]BBH18768.1 aldehyde dehydrogenase [Paenibacillus baekrokdamisoli]